MSITLRDIVIVFVIMALLETFAPRDDTDPPDGRSDLTLMTDNATGVQYLSHGWFGAPTPRLNADGSLHRAERR